LNGRAKNLVGPSTGNITLILSIALGLSTFQEIKVSTMFLGALVEPDCLGSISPNKLSRINFLLLHSYCVSRDGWGLMGQNKPI